MSEWIFHIDRYLDFEYFQTHPLYEVLRCGGLDVGYLTHQVFKTSFVGDKIDEAADYSDAPRTMNKDELDKYGRLVVYRHLDICYDELWLPAVIQCQEQDGLSRYLESREEIGEQRFVSGAFGRSPYVCSLMDDVEDALYTSIWLGSRIDHDSQEYVPAQIVVTLRNVEVPDRVYSAKVATVEDVYADGSFANQVLGWTEVGSDMDRVVDEIVNQYCAWMSLGTLPRDYSDGQ